MSIEAESAKEAWQALPDPDIGAEEISRIYERNLSSKARLTHGQYYTPYPLCDLMLSLAYHVKHYERILEPSCGSGAFLLRAAARVANQNPTDRLQMVGVDQDPDAIQLARKFLSQTAPHIPVTLVQRDFLTLPAETLGHFDLIIGNPPYVRQELFGQAPAGDKLNRLKQFQEIYKNYLTEFPEQAQLFSRKADLYQWFFLQAWQALAPGGVLTFVVSNSWLDTVFGKRLQHFLLRHFHWLYLVESASERWFEDAAINPVIVVLQKKRMPDEPSAQPCQFAQLLQPLTNWLPGPQSPDYWQQLDQMIQDLPTDPAVRFRAIPPEQLGAVHQNGNWNLALRAPDVLSQLIEIKRLWRPLASLGSVRYPIKTGINAFFYLSEKQVADWRIEPEFLVPVIRSTKKLPSLKVKSAQLNEFLFCCPLDKQQLKAAGKTGALAYIEWGEQQTSLPRQKRFTPTPWPEVPSVRNNRPWCAIQRLTPPHLLCNRFVDQRYFFALCEGDFVEDQTFYGLTLNNPEANLPDLIAGLLNSTLSCALLEFRGRVSLGEGVLQFARCDMAAFPLLDPDLYTKIEQEKIRQAFAELAQQPLNRWQQDWNHPARLALDEAVLTPLLKFLSMPIDALTLRYELAQAMLKRYQERKAMARSGRKKQR